MLGDGLGELELLPAFLATVLIGGHGSKSSGDVAWSWVMTSGLSLEIVNKNIPESATHCENYSRPAKRRNEALSRLIEPRIIVPLLRHACSPMLGDFWLRHMAIR